LFLSGRETGKPCSCKASRAEAEIESWTEGKWTHIGEDLKEEFTQGDDAIFIPANTRRLGASRRGAGRTVSISDIQGYAFRRELSGNLKETNRPITEKEILLEAAPEENTSLN